MEDKIADGHQIRQSSAGEAEVDGEIGIAIIESILRGEEARFSSGVQRFGVVGKFKDDRTDAGGGRCGRIKAVFVRIIVGAIILAVAGHGQGASQQRSAVELGCRDMHEVFTGFIGVEQEAAVDAGDDFVNRRAAGGIVARLKRRTFTPGTPKSSLS